MRRKMLITRTSKRAAAFAGCLRRCLHVTSKKQNQLEPINMAYASYEITTPVSTSPLLIMHGLFGSKANWNSLSKALQQKTQPPRKIIAADARNHGDSPHTNHHSYEHLSEDILRFLQQMNIKSASLLGHSMGGRAAMLFALKHVRSFQERTSCCLPFCFASPS